MTFSVDALRSQFPILASQVRGKPLVYLDNGATTQKPLAVIEAIDRYYRSQNSNVHRGAHYLSDVATAEFEGARQIVADFLNATREEILWTRGTTESINLVAQCYGREQLQPGDEVLISAMEHHSNIVPWQLACQRTGASLKVIPVLADGSLDMDAFHSLLNERTRIVALVQVSNSLGTVNPVAEMIVAAKKVGAVTLIDGAQAVSHFAVDMRALACDFYAFSAHKVFGPTGIGVLSGKRALLEAMVPSKSEAGAPNMVCASACGAPLRWRGEHDRTALQAREADLLAYATEQAQAFAGLKLVGTAPNKVSVMSFLLDGAHPNDAGHLLDQQGIAVRTGHHCTMPLMDHFGIPGTVRASFSVYNSRDDVDALFRGLDKVRTFL